MANEYFCEKADVSASSTQVETAPQPDVGEGNVLLQVMKIPWLDKKDGCEFVLWDTACNGTFVRREHEERMNFLYRERKLCMRTLGGEEKDIEGRIYDCQIRDLEGIVHQFKTHSLDKVTGNLGDALSREVLWKLFLRI